jgi:uncharacterized protein YcnI
MRFSFALAAGLVAAGFVSISPASAHVTLEVREAPVDSSYKAVFSVPHGCEGSATTRVRFRMPAGVTGVKPQPRAGWELSTVKTKLEKPIKGGHGEEITETVTEVVWSGGKLLDEHFDQFVMRMALPKVAPGTVLYFPVVQECEKGVNRWIEIPEDGKKSGDYKQPAPALRLISKP